MNKYNMNGAGFEVSRTCGRIQPRNDLPSGSYGETLNRRACGCEGNGCGTEADSRYGLHDRPMGSVYAPLQDFDRLYDHERALMRGTLFSTLDLPLEVGRGGRCNG